MVDESDPRVARDSGDLYVLGAPSQPGPDDGKLVTSPNPGGGPGSGVPDEANGVCRLYAPKLPSPMCCPSTFGVSIRRVRELCGHTQYLGESMHGSCGYHFADAAGEPSRWFRVSTLAFDSPKAAAERDDALMRRRQKLPEFASTPIPAIPGAFWSTFEGYHWAYLPGWEMPRMVTWQDGFCDEQAMLTLLSELAKAAPDQRGEARPLIPGDPVEGE